MPDFDYLIAKGIDVRDPRTLFDKLTLQMNKVSDENLKQDLIPLFVNLGYIENWLKNWRDSYLRLLDEYKINTVTTLSAIQISQHPLSDDFSFTYIYNTENEKLILVRYTISDYWIDFDNGNLPIEADEKLDEKIEFASDGIGSRAVPNDKLKVRNTFLPEN